MARLGGIRSEAQPTPSAGLASILRDQKAIFGASNGRSNVVIGMVDALGPQSVFVASSPESSLSEADIAADDWNEFQEEDLWAVERKSDLPRSLQVSYNGVPSLCPSINQLSLNGTAENVGVVVGFAKVDVDVADSLELGVKTKRRESGARTEHVFGFAKQRTSAGEVLRSSARRRERRPAVSDALKNVGLYCDAQVQGGLPSNLEKISSRRRSTAALMIPQFGGGMSRRSSKRHAEHQSAPVQVPDWSKMMAKQSGNLMVMVDGGEEGEKDNDDDRLPPHELLRKEYARSQITTFSVCEGQGRTLKGRDLSRVRDAVWSQMGFAD